MIINVPNGKTGALASATPLSFESTDNGKTYRSIVPILAVPNTSGAATDSSLIVNEVVDVTSQVETTSRGVRRILLKATMPYVSVSEQKCCGTDSSTVSVNTARTNESISCHLVFTIPSGAVKDFSSSGYPHDAVITKAYLVKYLIDTLLRTTSSVGNIPLEDDSDLTLPNVKVDAGVMSVSTVSYQDGVYQGFATPLERGLAGLTPLSNSTYGAKVSAG